MPSFSANAADPAPIQRQVVFVVYPDIVLLDLVGPLQVFSHACEAPGAGLAYQTKVVALGGGQVLTNTILSIHAEEIESWSATPESEQIDTLIVIGGDGAYEASALPAFIAQIQTLAARSRRVCSVCSGALVLAAAGLLKNRRAVTHWEDCDYLAAHYPDTKVEVDPIYVKDGHIWTSAGITAGIDMALALVQEDLGSAAAIAMARSLVTPMVRAGGQSQFSAELGRQARDAQGRFSNLHEWLKANIQRDISVEDMAQHCGMSARNFSRRYRETLGIAPAKSLELLRVEAARDALAATKLSVKMVAQRCGFKDDERMRRAFLRHVKVTPSHYRDQFQLEARKP